MDRYTPIDVTFSTAHFTPPTLPQLHSPLHVTPTYRHQYFKHTYNIYTWLWSIGFPRDYSLLKWVHTNIHLQGKWPWFNTLIWLTPNCFQNTKNTKYPGLLLFAHIFWANSKLCNKPKVKHDPWNCPHISPFRSLWWDSKYCYGSTLKKQGLSNFFTWNLKVPSEKKKFLDWKCNKF